jgi:hypothetical protein
MSKGRARLALVIFSAVVLAVAGLSYRCISDYLASSGFTSNSSSAQAKAPSSNVVERIEAAQPTQVDTVIDGIWRLAALEPREMADGVPAWLGPLMRDHRYADVEAMSLVAILQKAWDPQTVAVCQEARVRALLAEGMYPQALSEAKSYYNVAPLADTPTAIDLLRQAWSKAHDHQDTGEPGIPEILRSAKVNYSVIEPAIDGTKQGSEFKFANQISQGNLLLLADRPQEAEQSFLKGCAYVDPDRDNTWDFPKALAGIAESVRDQEGSLDRAKSLVRAWQAGRRTADGIAIASNIEADRLQDAARQVETDTADVRSALPVASGDSLNPIGLPPPCETPFSLPVDDPIVLARMCPQCDPELRAWLDQWQVNLRHGRAVDQQELDALRQVLMQSNLSDETFLAMLDSFHAISQGTNTSRQWLTICARRIDPKLADRLGRRSQEQPGQDQQLGELDNIIANPKLTCEWLYQFAQLVNDIGGDPSTAAQICAIAVARGHQELSQYEALGDRVRPILWAMKKCESLLWDEMGTQNGPQYARVIETLAGDLDRWVPENDPSLGWARIWARVSTAECATIEGDYERALAILQPLKLDSLPPDQQDGVVWAKAMALVREGQNDLAIVQLKICAGNRAFRHSGSAWQALALVYSKLGKQREAHQAFEYWVQTYRPPLGDALRAMDSMNHPGEMVLW